MYSYLPEIIISLGICVVLPVTVVALITRMKTNATNRRAEIALAAIEKDSNIDMEAFFRKMNPPSRTIKEKLLNKLLWGCAFTVVGVCILALMLIICYGGGYDKDTIYFSSFFGAISLALGIAFLISYAVGRKMLKQEMEAELKNMLEQA